MSYKFLGGYMDSVTLNLTNMLLDNSFDNLKLTPEVIERYEKYLIENRTKEQIEEQ